MSSLFAPRRRRCSGILNKQSFLGTDNHQLAIHYEWKDDKLLRFSYDHSLSDIRLMVCQLSQELDITACASVEISVVILRSLPFA